MGSDPAGAPAAFYRALKRRRSVNGGFFVTSVLRLGRPKADIVRLCLVIPPEPPVADLDSPQRRAAGKGAPVFGAAERTLAREHRCGTLDGSTGGSGGITRPSCILLVSSEAAREEGGFQRGKKPLVSFPFGLPAIDRSPLAVCVWAALLTVLRCAPAAIPYCRRHRICRSASQTHESPSGKTIPPTGGLLNTPVGLVPR
jgi:hypothetical protein